MTEKLNSDFYENLRDDSVNTGTFKTTLVTSSIQVGNGDEDHDNINDTTSTEFNLVVDNQNIDQFQPTKMYTLWDFNVVLFCTNLLFVVSGFWLLSDLLMYESYDYDEDKKHYKPATIVGSVCLWFPAICFNIAIILDWIARRYFGCCCCSVPMGCKCEYKYSPEKAILPNNCLVIFCMIGFLGHIAFGIYMILWLSIDKIWSDDFDCWGDILTIIGMYINLLGMEFILIKDIIPTINNINGKRTKQWLLRDLSLLIFFTSLIFGIVVVSRMTSCKNWREYYYYDEHNDIADEYADDYNTGLIIYCILFFTLMFLSLWIFIFNDDPSLFDKYQSYTLSWIIQLLPIIIYLGFAIIPMADYHVDQAISGIITWMFYVGPQLILYEIFIWKKIRNSQNNGCCCNPCCGQTYTCCCDEPPIQLS